MAHVAARFTILFVTVCRNCGEKCDDNPACCLSCGRSLGDIDRQTGKRSEPPVHAFAPNTGDTAVVRASPVWLMVLCLAGLLLLAIAVVNQWDKTTEYSFVEKVVGVIAGFGILGAGLFMLTGVNMMEIDPDLGWVRVTKTRLFFPNKSDYAPLAGLSLVSVELDDPMSEGPDWVVVLRYHSGEVVMLEKSSCVSKKRTERLAEPLYRYVSR